MRKRQGKLRAFWIALALMSGCAKGGTDTCDASSGTCECNANRDCEAARPVCDLSAHACRTCRRHDECASWVCRYDVGLPDLVAVGQCYPPEQVAVVDASCQAAADGSREHPFCDLPSALQAGKPLIAVRPRAQSLPYGVAAISAGRVTIVGPGREAEPQAVLAGVQVSGKDTAVSLYDLTLRSDTDFALNCIEGQASLYRSTVEFSYQGVNSSDGCRLTIERSRIAGNDRRALRAMANTRYRIVNSLIAQNGKAFTPVDHMNQDDVVVELGSNLNDNVFSFNTIIGNQGTISCRLGQTLRNSIIASKDPPVLSASCAQDHLFVGDEDEPKFDTRYALTRGSDCCIDKALEDRQVLMDYDGSARPQGGGWDIGCFETR